MDLSSRKSLRIRSSHITLSTSFKSIIINFQVWPADFLVRIMRNA